MSGMEYGREIDLRGAKEGGSRRGGRRGALGGGRGEGNSAVHRPTPSLPSLPPSDGQRWPRGQALLEPAAIESITT